MYKLRTSCGLMRPSFVSRKVATNAKVKSPAALPRHRAECGWVLPCQSRSANRTDKFKPIVEVKQAYVNFIVIREQNENTPRPQSQRKLQSLCRPHYWLIFRAD